MGEHYGGISKQKRRKPPSAPPIPRKVGLLNGTHFSPKLELGTVAVFWVTTGGHLPMRPNQPSPRRDFFFGRYLAQAANQLLTDAIQPPPRPSRRPAAPKPNPSHTQIASPVAGWPNRGAACASWWHEARFGMFIFLGGLYSVLAGPSRNGDGEKRESTPSPITSSAAKRFQAQSQMPRSAPWASLQTSRGQKYIVLTFPPRQHEGCFFSPSCKTLHHQASTQRLTS